MALLSKDMVQVTEGRSLNWKEAIQQAATPLVNNDVIGEDYVESMIDVVNETGPYINIGPEIALAHSRPTRSVKKAGLALLKTNQDVYLVNKDHPVKLWFVLAAVDNNSHLEIIQKLSKILMQRDTVRQLLAAKNVNDILVAVN